MPIVPVHLAEGGDDWEMIELQGELQAEGGILDGQEIGVLSVDPKVVGHTESQLSLA
jgi:hypothetical protein